MKPLIFPTEVNAEKLKRGCLLACIAHAIVVVQDPEFSYEHSWDELFDHSGCTERNGYLLSRRKLYCGF